MAHQPQNLVVTPISTTEIELSWDDVGTLEDETFDIERNSVIVEASYAGTHTPAAPYTDTGLDPNTEYTYRVRAVGGIIPSPVTPPAAAVAARVVIFTPAITVSANAEVTPTTVTAVAAVFVSDIATTTSTVTPATVVGTASVELPAITGESYSDSYALPYGATGVSDADVTLSTVVTASTVLTPTVTTVFSPSSITGLVAWFDFSDVSTLFQNTTRTTAVTADGQQLQGVTDKSGGGYHLAEASSMPVYKPSIQNGLSVARFASSKTRNTSFAALTSATVFAVIQTASGSSGVVSMGTVVNQGYQLAKDGTTPRAAAYPGSQVLSTGAAWSHSVWGIEHLVHGGGNLKLYRDGSLLDTDAAGAHTSSTSNLNIGVLEGYTIWPMNGDIGEILIYSSGLSAADQNAIGAYLQAKWATPTWTTVT